MRQVADLNPLPSSAGWSFPECGTCGEGWVLGWLGIKALLSCQIEGERPQKSPGTKWTPFEPHSPASWLWGFPLQFLRSS